MHRYRFSAVHMISATFAQFTRTWFIGSIVICCLVFGAVALLLTGKPNPDAQLTLQAPAFVSSAYASDLNQTPTFPSDIGISAYFKAPNAITINNRLRGIYRTIEDQTDDYIVGSVAIEGYDTLDDVHVYIHKDGWVLAFYRSDEPASKIIDWKGYTAGSNAVPNKLTKALATAAGAAGVGVPAQPSYYHFQYPEANRMTIALQSAEGSGDVGRFTLRLPSDGFVYFETSYAFGGEGRLNINDEQVANTNGDFGVSAKTTPVLLPEKEHSVAVVGDCCSNVTRVGAILVIYKEQ